MQDKQFHQIYEVENDHFWYKARREIIEAVLKSHNLCQNQFSVLEIGSANGTNIQYFKHYFKSMKGSEINLEAIKIASKKLPNIQFTNGHLPYNIGYGNEKFDIIFLFDVLEHVENDFAALQEIKKRLKNNAKLIITVPAYQFLFGQFDVDSCHYRRYNINNLTKKVTSQGFSILFKSYFNFWLFPLVLISRLVEKILKKSSGHAVTNQAMPKTNNLFYKIMRTEKKWLGQKKYFPFGSSIILIASKIDHDSI